MDSASQFVRFNINKERILDPGGPPKTLINVCSNKSLKTVNRTSLQPRGIDVCRGVLMFIYRKKCLLIQMDEITVYAIFPIL